MKALWRHALSTLLFAALVGCGGGGGGGSAGPVTPLPAAQGKYFGYYGDWPGQVAATADHVNLLWVWGFYDWNLYATERLVEAQQYGIECVVMGFPQSFERNGEALIRAALTEWRSRGLLARICAVTPVDEPDVNGVSASALRAWASMMRGVLADYPELANVKLAVIYGSAGRPAIEVFDWIGFDNYEMGADVLDEPLRQLKSQLFPTQRIFLLAGGGDPWRQDVRPFYEKLVTDPQILGLIAFVYFDTDNGARRGIAVNGLAKMYCETGRRIKFPGIPNPTCAG